MVGSLGAYVAQVDRVLGAGQGLFAASGGEPAPLDGGPPVVPVAPRGAGLTDGATQAGHLYERGVDGVRGLDARAEGAAAAGAEERQRGQAGAAVTRHSAQAQAAGLAPVGGSAAGVRLLVTRMDAQLAAMQRQITDTQASNRLLAARLREVAAAYQDSVGAAVTEMPGGAAGLPASGGPVAASWGLPGGSAGEGHTSHAPLDALLGPDRAGGAAAQRAVAYAASKVGAPYVWGAAGPDTYDCSGLVRDAYAHAGIALPHSTFALIGLGTAVGRDEVRAGDLVFSNFSARGPEHVQLAVSPSMVIEAPAPGGHVQFSGLPSGRIVVKRVA